MCCRVDTSPCRHTKSKSPKSDLSGLVFTLLQHQLLLRFLPSFFGTKRSGPDQMTLSNKKKKTTNLSLLTFFGSTFREAIQFAFLAAIAHRPPPSVYASPSLRFTLMQCNITKSWLSANRNSSANTTLWTPTPLFRKTKIYSVHTPRLIQLA